MISAGFRTAANTLYWIDPIGRTHRFVDGAVESPQTCIYLDGLNADVVRQAMTQGDDIHMVRLVAGVLEDCKDAALIHRNFAEGNRPGVRITSMHTQFLLHALPAWQHPGVTMFPFQENEHTSSLGARITRLYSEGEVVREGFPIGHMLNVKRVLSPA